MPKARIVTPFSVISFSGVPVPTGLLLVLFCVTWPSRALDLEQLDSIPARKNYDSLTPFRPMGLSDFTLGVNERMAHVQDSVPGNKFVNSAFGVSARMQSSILWSYKSPDNTRRFMWGDILAAEVFAGQLTTGFSHQTKGIWVAYSFEFGFGGRFKINNNSEAGLNVILLKFSKDNVSGNVSGSGITARYRVRRILAEAGAEARHDRVLGIATDLSRKIPLQTNLTARYLLKKGRNIGINLSTLQSNYLQDGISYSRTWSLKIFYGIYF
jgi:hypothetical protein